jgi:hypothetical protein
MADDKQSSNDWKNWLRKLPILGNGATFLCPFRFFVAGFAASFWNET